MNRDPQETIADLCEAISELLAGRTPQSPLFRRTGSEEIDRLCEAVSTLVATLNEANLFINALSQGNLEEVAPVHNFLVSPFKQLQSSLRHLTWQAQQIAAGDLSQQVDFLGEFSDAFNSMIESLRQKKRMGEALRDSEERFRQMAESIQGVFWLMESGDPERLIYISPAVKAIWGLTPEAAYNGPEAWIDLVHPEDRALVVQRVADCVASGQEYSVEYRIVRHDRSLRWVWSKGFAVRDAEGRVYRVAGITHDITQHKLDQEYQQQLHEEIREFAYIVSHDLRSPLINLKGFGGELRASLELVDPVVRDAVQSLPDERKRPIEAAISSDIPEALDFIDLSVSRMSHLIEAILGLSRTGRRELEFELLDMNELVQGVLGSMAHQLEQRGVAVFVRLLPDVVADRISMEQIIGNLLDNAVKYLDAAKPGKIEVSGERGFDATFFRVADNGRGIDQRDVKRVFAPFQRAGKQDVRGEGMGLAHVRTLVRRHGGRLWCESVPGEGSTFAFTVASAVGSSDMPPDFSSNGSLAV